MVCHCKYMSSGKLVLYFVPNISIFSFGCSRKSFSGFKNISKPVFSHFSKYHLMYIEPERVFLVHEYRILPINIYQVQG
jgi:hypothetical protein